LTGRDIPEHQLYRWTLVPDGRDRFCAAALRHLLAWKGGEDDDPSSRLPHLALAMANVMLLHGLGPDAC
jgi:hypothetical protein